jgi:hypothetical protein
MALSPKEGEEPTIELDDSRFSELKDTLVFLKARQTCVLPASLINLT